MPAMPHESGVASVIGGLPLATSMHVQHLNDQPADPAMLHALAPHGYTWVCGLYRGPTRRMHALGVSSL